MAILLKNDMLFLHIPKTGGNWITEVLEINGLIKKNLPEKHDTLELLKKRHPNLKYNKIFCFVRDPLSWYKSWFQYSTAKNWRNWGKYKWHPCKPLNGLGATTFNDFIKNIIDRCPSYVSNLYGLYTKDCDFIGKQENLEKDLIKVLEFDGELKLTGPVGVSKDLNLRWNYHLKKKIIEAEKDIFEKYYE